MYVLKYATVACTKNQVLHLLTLKLHINVRGHFYSLPFFCPVWHMCQSRQLKEVSVKPCGVNTQPFPGRLCSVAYNTTNCMGVILNLFIDLEKAE